MMQRRITRAAGPAKAAAGLPAVRSFFAFRLPAGAGGFLPFMGSGGRF